MKVVIGLGSYIFLPELVYTSLTYILHQHDISAFLEYEFKFLVWNVTDSSSCARRGLVVGWDYKCCETEEWMQQARVTDLAPQPYYHVCGNKHYLTYGNSTDVPRLSCL
jgi:hypothetical protein